MMSSSRRAPGELGHEQRPEVELCHDLGATGAQEAALPDLAEPLADHEVLALADALVGDAHAVHGVDLGAGEDVVQRVFVEDDRADVGGSVVELEQLGDEGGVLVEKHAARLRGERADGLEVAGVQAALAQRQAQADGDGRLAAAALGGGDVERLQHHTPRRRLVGVEDDDLAALVGAALAGRRGAGAWGSCTAGTRWPRRR